MELLIVVVVIAILAAITIISFNGIQTSAKVSAVQTDLRNIATQMELFKVKHGVYPSAAQSPRTDLETILKAANLYRDTRAIQADWLNGIYPSKRFVFCSPNGDGETFAVVATAPLMPTNLPPDNLKTYAVDQTGDIKEIIFVHNGVSEASSLCVAATGVPLASWNIDWYRWSNSIPDNWAS